MPENMPQNPTDALEWIELRAERWVQNAAALGLSETLAQEVLDLAEIARSRRRAADEAAVRARSATRSWRNGIRDAKRRTRAAIAAIKAQAAATGDPGVYTLALLSGRAKPSEAPPPQTPRDLAFTVRPNGEVELWWKGGGPQGTFYIVQRSFDGGKNWSVLGTTTSKRFVDEDLPTGLDEIHYAAIARHGEHAVWGSPLLVRLGTRPARRHTRPETADRAA
jgi:hypothetical protein